MAGVTLQNCRDLLSRMNGETSTPTGTERDAFINDTIRDIYSTSDWPWRRVVLTPTWVTTTDGNGVTTYVATMPSDYADDSFNDLRVTSPGASNDKIYTKIEETERDGYVNGDYRVWQTGNDVDGFTLNIWEPGVSPVLDYWSQFRTDLSNASDTTKVPLARVIVFGAYALLRIFNDPDYDNTKEWSLYMNELNQLRGYYNRSRSNRLIGPSERAGTYIGRVVR